MHTASMQALSIGQRARAKRATFKCCAGGAVYRKKADAIGAVLNQWRHAPHFRFILRRATRFREGHPEEAETEGSAQQHRHQGNPPTSQSRHYTADSAPPCRKGR